MSGKRKRRFAKRVQVRFWKQGDEQVYSGYTTNISTTGMFIGTNSPVVPGSRVRVEIIDSDNGFLLEGVVVHAARVSPLLRKLRESGMGVRFLSVGELFSGIMPAEQLEQEEVIRPDPAEARGAASEPEPAATDAGLAAPPPPRESPPAPSASSAAAPSPGPAPAPAEAAPPKTGFAIRARSSTPAPPPPPSEKVFPIEFASAEEFRRVFERDIRNGGAFIPSPDPAGLQQNVLIELRLPAPIGKAIRFRAHVVHSQPGMGMGVQFLDHPGVVAEIEKNLRR